MDVVDKVTQPFPYLLEKGRFGCNAGGLGLGTHSEDPPSQKECQKSPGLPWIELEGVCSL